MAEDHLLLLQVPVERSSKLLQPSTFTLCVLRQTQTEDGVPVGNLGVDETWWLGGVCANRLPQYVCHGSPQGKAGFRLSLFGSDRELDRMSLTREFFGRRTNLIEPDKSLLTNSKDKRRLVAKLTTDLTLKAVQKALEKGYNARQPQASTINHTQSPSITTKLNMPTQLCPTSWPAFSTRVILKVALKLRPELPTKRKAKRSTNELG